MSIEYHQSFCQLRKETHRKNLRHPRGTHYNFLGGQGTGIINCSYMNYKVECCYVMGIVRFSYCALELSACISVISHRVLALVFHMAHSITQPHTYIALIFNGLNVKLLENENCSLWAVQHISHRFRTNYILTQIMRHAKNIQCYFITL